MDRFRNKLKTIAELADLVSKLRRKGTRVVLANGCFDLLHVGHIRYLQAARAAGDRLIVAVNSDESVRDNKGEGRPLMPEQERAELLSELECVDYILIFSDSNVEQLLQKLRPDAHAKGTDYQVDSVPERAAAKALGIETIIVGDPKDHSTSDLIGRIVQSKSDE